MATTIAKTANINVRVDKDVKERSESILSEMGMSMSTAINSFLRQIITERSLPYRPSTKRAKITTIDDFASERDFIDYLNEGIVEANSGRTTPKDVVMKELEEDFGVKILD
ncbi:type II toxin-antitoxin system RelB/DinJ family antitoxin [Candidatus Saccharibacteria bacterium]|nr:type II toxin-antitoxin system RelB/DinJ family antitoxin [Candidatus Saccharibacteria bacterium]